MDSRRIPICEDNASFPQEIRENFLFFRRVPKQPLGKAFLFSAFLEYCLFYNLGNLSPSFLESLILRLNFEDLRSIIAQRNAAELDNLMTSEQFWNTLCILSEDILNNVSRQMQWYDNSLQANLHFLNSVSSLMIVYIMFTGNNIDTCTNIISDRVLPDYGIFFCEDSESSGNFYILYPACADMTEVTRYISRSLTENRREEQVIKKDNNIPIGMNPDDFIFIQERMKKSSNIDTISNIKQSKAESNKRKKSGNTNRKNKAVSNSSKEEKCSVCNSQGNIIEKTSGLHYCLECSKKKHKSNKNLVIYQQDHLTKLECCRRFFKNQPLIYCKKGVHFGHKECVDPPCKQCEKNPR